MVIGGGGIACEGGWYERKLSELQARDVVRRVHLLRMCLNSFAAHARTLRTMSQNKTGLDDRMLLDQANHLTRRLIDTFTQYQTAESRVGSLHRSVPDSGMALQRMTITAMNSPLRTRTMPGG